mmetsp:Transcript_11001/g.16681  ORF Transcript_11001/g.16681 Transcript_11001/m.16681 type:complete len:232 (-) Transcript_11001:1499-2194(-)
MSLNGPMGSNYQYACCDKEMNVTAIFGSASDVQSGCETQVHEVSETFGMEQAKEKKTTDRIIAHQLIILENTVNDQYIEKIFVREFNKKMDEKESSIKLSRGNGKQPSSLVRPSSLNYKISLREAVTEFIKKDMPVGDDQFVHVETEEHKVTSSSNSRNNNNHDPYEDYIDIMWDMTVPSTKQTTGKRGQPQTPINNPDTNNGKDSWFREEELMRKKLEKGAINQLKSRIA